MLFYELFLFKKKVKKGKIGWEIYESLISFIYFV